MGNNGQRPVSEQIISDAGEQTRAFDESKHFFMRWLPSILSVSGLVISWDVSAVLGLMLSIVGVLFGISSGNKLNKAISVIVGIICALLSLIVIVFD